MPKARMPKKIPRTLREIKEKRTNLPKKSNRKTNHDPFLVLLFREPLGMIFKSLLIIRIINLIKSVSLHFRFNFLRCVVWTGDGRVFFYNPSSRISVWERPEDLVGRADVEKMVSNVPEALGSIKKARESDSSESSDEDQPPPTKKVKQEEPKGNDF